MINFILNLPLEKYIIFIEMLGYMKPWFKRNVEFLFLLKPTLYFPNKPKAVRSRLTRMHATDSPATSTLRTPHCSAPPATLVRRLSPTQLPRVLAEYIELLVAAFGYPRKHSGKPEAAPKLRGANSEPQKQCSVLSTWPPATSIPAFHQSMGLFHWHRPTQKTV